MKVPVAPARLARMYVITVATVRASASKMVAKDAASVKTRLSITSELDLTIVSEFKQSNIPALSQFTSQSDQPPR